MINETTPVPFVFDDKKYYPGDYKFNWDEQTQFVYKFPENGKLVIKILEGIDLISMDLNGKSDPYVKIHVPRLVEDKDEKQLKTSTKYETLTPKWNESFHVEVERVEDDLVVLEVWDKDTIGSDDFLGFVTIDASLLPYNQEVVTIENLSYVDKGKLKISITALNYGWDIKDELNRYVEYRERLVGSLPFYIEREELKIKRMDQYSKNREQGPYVNVKPGQLKRIYKKYSIVNGWIKSHKAGENVKEGAKTAAMLAGAVVGVLFESAIENTRYYNFNNNF
ncbi:hypothetical protein DFA_11663 [Cavenderia fasciculata]|uniref:C2 domain-containing protein n=1 Tax=Cavenderia fasciculata TaxID=261658 RepID=F4QDV5_CACFS|nr:uncharacterized protein DFA_11663 [Cavenderia fasciculata]EGG13902.1 hypothetical protein DFA_11663 [Cavenderia fasciculata]|eukprot:XP_004350610.1 hypothetical protein DFA_11663 [Cavenderia fasciculata]